MEKLHLHVCCEGRWPSSRDANVAPDTLSPYAWERETTKQRWSQMTYAFALTIGAQHTMLILGISKEQRKWACQLWGRSEQVHSNERKLFSAHFKNENQKTFLEAHRMFWFLALKSAVSWHIRPLISPLEKRPNKMLFVSQGKQTTTEEGGILFSI